MAARERGKHRLRHELSGVRAVAAKLPFKLDAPSSLVGLKRRSVTLLDWKGTPAALGTRAGALLQPAAASPRVLVQPPGGQGA